MSAIRGSCCAILKADGEDPDRDGLLETPRRIAGIYAELFSGLQWDPGRHPEVTFDESYGGNVLERDILFTSMCEHHLLSFRGVAHIPSIRNGRVTGLSKLARVVENVSRRPEVQQRRTQTVADLIEDRLGSRAVDVIIKAEHLCMSIRGIRKTGSLTATSTMRGLCRSDPVSRAELMSLINRLN